MTAGDTLLLQAYGDARFLQQARFCILTAQARGLNAPGGPRVLVYTDQPAHFAELGPNVTAVAVTADQLHRWRGTIDFVHRVKLEVMLHALATVGERLLYVDCDTYFRVDPQTLFARIAPGHTLMRVSEGAFSNRSNGIQRKMQAFVRRHTFQLANGETVRIPEHTEMWDAGVIGIHAADTRLIRRALELTDAMYPLYPKHVIEQVAVSFVLQTASAVGAAGDAVYHYWRYTTEFARILEDFFAASAGRPRDEVATAAVALSPHGTPGRTRRWYARLLGGRR